MQILKTMMRQNRVFSYCPICGKVIKPIERKVNKKLVSKDIFYNYIGEDEEKEQENVKMEFFWVCDDCNFMQKVWVIDNWGGKVDYAIPFLIVKGEIVYKFDIKERKFKPYKTFTKKLQLELDKIGIKYY